MKIANEVAALNLMAVKDLRIKYAEVFGDSTNTANKSWLVKRIAWRLQAGVEGGLSERARRRAEELANESDLRLSPPKQTTRRQSVSASVRSIAPNRLPPAGTVITRSYKGETLHVEVLEDGFSYRGERYKTLSAVANAITGSHCNGFYFFRIGREAKS
jgi:hypothetical protein